MEKPALKNILIIDGTGATVTMGLLGLVHQPDTGIENSSADSRERIGRRAVIRHPALRTRDGMQLYCFRRAEPYEPGQEEADPNKRDPNHLNYWMPKLKEQLDAIIIPSGIGPLQYHKLELFLERMKKAHPQLQVIQLSASPLPEHALVDHTLIGVPPSEIGDTIRGFLGVPALPKETFAQRTAENRRNDRFRPKWMDNQDATPGYEPPGGDKGGRGGR